MQVEHDAHNGRLKLHQTKYIEKLATTQIDLAQFRKLKKPPKWRDHAELAFTCGDVDKFRIDMQMKIKEASIAQLDPGVGDAVWASYS